MRRYVLAGPRRAGLSASVGAWASGPDAADAFMRNARAMDPQITQAMASRLREIAAPAHIVWGRRDPFQNVRWAARLRDAIPGSLLTVLDGGHFLPCEVAHEIRVWAER
jgi:pimeloyl-ACP methyl ester carboxylesterase